MLSFRAQTASEVFESALAELAAVSTGIGQLFLQLRSLHPQGTHFFLHLQAAHHAPHLPSAHQRAQAGCECPGPAEGDPEALPLQVALEHRLYLLRAHRHELYLEQFMLGLVGLEQQRAVGPVWLRATLSVRSAGCLGGLLVAGVVLEKSLQDCGPA